MKLVLHVIASTVILGGALSLVRPLTVGDLIGIFITMAVVCGIYHVWFSANK
jgi:hypothetical protein